VLLQLVLMLARFYVCLVFLQEACWARPVVVTWQMTQAGCGDDTIGPQATCFRNVRLPQAPVVTK